MTWWKVKTTFQTDPSNNCFQLSLNNYDFCIIFLLNLIDNLYVSFSQIVKFTSLTFSLFAKNHMFFIIHIWFCIFNHDCSHNLLLSSIFCSNFNQRDTEAITRLNEFSFTIVIDFPFLSKWSREWHLIGSGHTAKRDRHISADTSLLNMVPIAK